MITLTIDSIDKTNIINWKSLNIKNVLTTQVDTCKFTTKGYEGHQYIPEVGREVIITHSGTRIFGGVIVRRKQRTDANVMNVYDVDCVDFTRLLDGKLVNQTYQDTTVDAIIADIISTYTTGFTTVNVNNPTQVAFVAFRYQNVSACLKALADLTKYQWYVDYTKDVHMFAKGDEIAPRDIIDTNGSYNRDTLIIRKDNRQIKNTVYVRGGTYLGDTFTAVYVGDATQNVYPLTYQYDEDNFQVTVTASEYSVGEEPVNNPLAYDVLHNNEARLLRFRDDRIPQNGIEVRVGGRPKLPVIVKVRDTAAIEAAQSAEGGSGTHEFIIFDKTLDTKEGARERARAELYAYARSLVEGEFKTLIDGFVAGQKVRINSDVLGLDTTFIISKVSTKMWTPKEPIYSITLISERTLGIIEVLQQLLNKDKLTLVVAPNELTDLVESTDEEITMTETAVASIVHNPISDEMTLADTVTGQSLNYDIQFVLGPYIWSGEGSGDHKRVFIMDGSILG